MRYERSSGGASSTEQRGDWRTRRLVAAAVGVVFLGAGAVAGVVASGGSSGSVPVASRRAQALERVVFETVVLEDDLGAPAPPGTGAADWALRSIPVARSGARPGGSPGGRDASVLLAPAYPWVGGDGRVELLATSAARALVATQSADVAEVTAGELAGQLGGQLASIVAHEQHSDASLSAPGGARLVEWYSVVVHGGRATVDGVVDNWEELVTVTGSGAHRRLVASLRSAELEVLASLHSVGARWKVASLAEKPYQQAT